MRCLKCKKEIANNILHCNYCGTKVRTVCPICGAKNAITSEYCEGCGLQLLKHCESCGSVNRPDTPTCRKCGAKFDDDGLVSISDLNKINTIVQNETLKQIEEDTVPLQLSKINDYENDEASSLSLTATLSQKVDSSEQSTDSEKYDTADFQQSKKDESEQIVENTESVVASEKPEIVESVEDMDLEIMKLVRDNDESLDTGVVEACDQMKCKNKLEKAIKNPDKLIIGMSANEGAGKSTVLRYLLNDLAPQNYAWLWGECSANSQISPFGIFQEMILTFFNMPDFSNMSNDFLKQAKTMLSETFPALSNDEIFELFNFLYPHLTANFEEILTNKDKTFALLEKVVLEISKKAKLIIVIDDFDMIDGASYAFLTYFVEQGNLSDNIKLIITYKDNRITQGYFYSEKLAQNQYEDIRLAKLTIKEADNLIKIYLNGANPLPQEIFEQFYENSNGSSAFIEQFLVMLNEQKMVVRKKDSVIYLSEQTTDDLPKDIYDILSVRLDYLEEKFPKVYQTLCTAAVMGNKFNIKLLEIIMKYSEEEFSTIVKMLSKSAYIASFNNNIYEFKNTLLWTFVYERAKQSSNFVVLNEKIYDIINSFTLSSNALKALIAQNLNQKLLALNIWTENIKLCAYLGDEHLWTLSQKQCLKIAQEVNPENNHVIINNIQERLGKLLYLEKPSEAIGYLANAINNAIKVDNQPKIIELSGYLSKSCSLTGNYNGVIEAIDTILKYLPPEKKLESALIKYKKLKALFSIGNAEEIYSIASSEIIPIVEQALSGNISNNKISMDKIYETWLECNLITAMALTSQGNKKAIDILYVIDDIVEKNNVTNRNYLQRVQLAKALAFSVQGSIKRSEDILLEFSQVTAKEVVEPEIISMWNFINILNKIYKHDWANIKSDMYSVVTFANNYNDVLIKNLLKVFLGKILQEEGSLAKAMDIFNEQVTIFAREKIAIGALLCWYFLAKITLITEGTDKALDIAQKALDVAKNPKISNYYFMVLFKKLMAETYLIKGDTDAAKMYIEKSLMIAKRYDMKLQKVSIFLLYTKYLEEMALQKPQNKANYAHNTIETYKKVLALSQGLGIPEIEHEIEKNFASFKAYCQLNNINV